MYAQNDINDLLFKNDHLNNAYMGVQIVDYLDLIYHVQYNINVTYYIKRNICTISGNYHLKHSKVRERRPINNKNYNGHIMISSYYFTCPNYLSLKRARTDWLQTTNKLL